MGNNFLWWTDDSRNYRQNSSSRAYDSFRRNKQKIERSFDEKLKTSRCYAQWLFAKVELFRLQKTLFQQHSDLVHKTTLWYHVFCPLWASPNSLLEDNCCLQKSYKGVTGACNGSFFFIFYGATIWKFLRQLFPIIDFIFWYLNFTTNITGRFLL